MEKTVPEMAVLFTRHQLHSPAEIPGHAGKDIPDLEKLAKDNGFETAGPVVNVYWNMATKGVPHYLEIWLPVKKKEKEKEKESETPALKAYKVVEPYRCLARTHKEGLEFMGQAWEEFGKSAMKKKAEISGQDREVYVTLDFEDPKKNLIELQMGIR
ncbi:MAG: hypothetical protein ABIW76_04790 [Fibrobacteria bacterium]